MSAPYCATNQAIMAQAALLAAWGLPLPENVLHQIVDELQGHIWYPPQEDLTLSDDEEGEIELVPNQSPGPIDSDDDMPVAEAWRRKLAAPVQPPARKRARRAVVYSDPESDSESDASDLEDLITYEHPIYSSNDREWACDCRVCKRGGLCDGYYEYEYELELSQ